MLGRKLWANIALLKDKVSNIVVKGKAIMILLPGLRDKSLFVEASELTFDDTHEQIRCQQGIRTNRSGPWLTRNRRPTHPQEWATTNSIKLSTWQIWRFNMLWDREAVMSFARIETLVAQTCRKQVVVQTTFSLHSRSKMFPETHQDKSLLVEVDEADIDDSNEADNDGIDGVVEECPSPMLPMLSPRSSISAMSNHDGGNMNFSLNGCTSLAEKRGRVDMIEQWTTLPWKEQKSVSKTVMWSMLGKAQRCRTIQTLQDLWQNHCGACSLMRTCRGITNARCLLRL